MSAPPAPVREYLPRAFYGAKFEPEEGILHGAGQHGPHAFLTYARLFEEGGHRPLIVMEYTGVNHNLELNLRNLASQMELYESEIGYVLPQLGLSMTSDGNPEHAYEHKVAAGEHDGNLRRAFAFWESTGRPLFLRIGYECNGPWNGYSPEEYIPAFRRVSDIAREVAPTTIATVWCVEGGLWNNAREYYPGDAYVDWMAIDIFGAGHIEHADNFLELARAHGKPVMIGESTPRGLTVGKDEVWAEWFEPFFALIARSPGIKATGYIHWDWALHVAFTQWGDARIDQDPEVLRRYRAEKAHPLYRHARPEQETKALLRMNVE